MTSSAQPHSLSLSTPPTSSYNRTIDNDTHLEARSSSPKKYHPYIPRSGPIPPGLHYAARSLGIMSPTDLTLDEVEQQRDAFIDALSAMPDRILLKAFDSKRADHECIALRLALTTAEIKSSEERISFLSAVREEHDADLAVSGAHLDILTQVLGSRGLAEAKDNKQYYEGEHSVQLAALAIAQTHMAQMYDVIGPGCSRWLGEDNGGSKVCLSDDEDDEELCHSDGTM